MKKVFSILVVLVLILSLAVPAYAAAPGGNSGSDKENNSAVNTDKTQNGVKDNGNGTQLEEEQQNAGTDSNIQNQTGNSGNGTQLGEEQQNAGTESNIKNEVKVENKNQLKGLKEQYQEAKKNGNLEQEKQLKQQYEELCNQYKEQIRNMYTQEETTQLKLQEQKMKNADPALEVFPVENIIAVGKQLKFDTPPVVKDGRILVPVRALSQAFGADVQWNEAERTVTIVKGDTTLVLQLDSSKVLVNGVETTLDVPAQSINGRTVVPIRFIVEKLGMNIDYDAEDGTAVIEDGTGTTTTTTTTTTNTDTGTATTTTTTTTTGTSTGTTDTTTTDTTGQ